MSKKQLKESRHTNVQSLEIKLDILNSKEVKVELGSLKDVFNASFGPTGRSCFIQHVNGGHVLVTSCSTQLLKSITSVSTPLTRLLLQSVQNHLKQYHDGGLFTALLTIQLLESSLKSSLPRHTIIAINEAALSLILEKLDGSSIKHSIDLSNIQQMLCVIRTVLVSKPHTGLSLNEVESLAVKLLQGFLSCIQSEKVAVLENLRIQTYEGPSSGESCFHTGILLESFCSVEKPIHENKGSLKVALFNCSLAGNVKDELPGEGKIELLNNRSFAIENNILKLMMKMVDDMIKSQVQLIACQKVIHPTLQLYITSHGLYFVERLSVIHIDAVQKISGAKLLSSYLGRINEDSYGSLEEIKVLTIHKKRFLHLIPNPGRKPVISTLLLCGPDEHSLDELKLVCSAALQSLKQLLYNPYVLPGGGCFETIVAGILQEAAKKCDGFDKMNCTKEQYLNGFHLVASVFLQISLALDHDGFHHLVQKPTFHHWKSRPLNNQLTTAQTPCLCGLMTSTHSDELYMVEELLRAPLMSTYVHNTSTEKIGENNHVIIDVMNVKVNGIRTAFETVNTILRVKHFVREFFDECGNKDEKAL